MHDRRVVGVRLDEVLEHRGIALPIAALLQDLPRLGERVVEHFVGRRRLVSRLVGGQRIVALADGDLRVAQQRLDLALFRVAAGIV